MPIHRMQESQNDAGSHPWKLKATSDDTVYHLANVRGFGENSLYPPRQTLQWAMALCGV